MHNQAAMAYQKMSQVGVNPRDLEATLLMKAAGRLQTLVDDWENLSGELPEHLTYNRRLWTILLAAVADDTSPLPQIIRNNVIDLGVFVMNRTLDVLSQPSAEKLGVLISINRNLAEGLRGHA